MTVEFVRRYCFQFEGRKISCDLLRGFSTGPAYDINQLRSWLLQKLNWR